MRTSINSLRKLVAVGIIIIIVLQICAVFSAPVKYTTSNVIFYYVIVYFAMRNLFSDRSHHICAFMWSLLTAYLLGWFWGAINILVYWVVYFMKVKYRSKTETEEEEEAEAEEEEEVDKFLGKDNNEIVKYFIKKHSRMKFPRKLKKQGFTLLLKIEPIMYIPFFKVNAFWHKIYIVKCGKSYSLYNARFFGILGNSITDLCSMHRPDITNNLTQGFGWGKIRILSDEDPNKPIKFLNSYEEACLNLANLVTLITIACKDNEQKRVMGELAPHSNKKK